MRVFHFFPTAIFPSAHAHLSLSSSRCCGMAVSRWMFTKEQILNTPSRKHGIDSDKELSYRQQAANLIQDMGQRLSVYPLFSDIFIV